MLPIIIEHDFRCCLARSKPRKASCRHQSAMNYLRMLSNDWNGPTAHFALLSRWKQLSAALMYSTYVRDAFSLFNSRTVNIERATNDLDPLLRVYASDSKPAICGTYYAMARGLPSCYSRSPTFGSSISNLTPQTI